MATSSFRMTSIFYSPELTGSALSSPPALRRLPGLVVAPRRILHRHSGNCRPPGSRTHFRPTQLRQAECAGQLSLVMRRKRQQRDVPRLLDGTGQPALMGGAHPGQPARHNLAPFRDKPLQKTNIPVRDGINLLGAELAHLLAPEKLTAATGTASGTGPTGAAAPTATRSALRWWCAAFGRLRALNFICHGASFSALLSALGLQQSILELAGLCRRSSTQDLQSGLVPSPDVRPSYRGPCATQWLERVPPAPLELADGRQARRSACAVSRGSL